MKVVSVAIPRPLRGSFTYQVPDEFLDRVKRGVWVRVPFGKSRLVGYAISDPEPFDTTSDLHPAKLRPIEEIAPPGFQIPENILKLAEWGSNFYQTGLGDLLASAAPTAAIGAKRQGKGRKIPKTAPTPQVNANYSRPILTDEQKKAVQTLSCDPEKPGLLHGVTGSGKTEVYIELARSALAQGKGVLLLVPEIALTPQLHARFEENLGTHVELWHSAMTDLSRQEKWVRIRDGESRVVVGARSAVFAPIQNLGLIIVDEEHEPTYKQEDRARYHARDLAVVRAKLEGASVVLGSATPSLESRERVREGRYKIAVLSKRIASGGIPSVEIADLVNEENIQGIQAPLSKRVLGEIQKTLDQGNQVMVFLNRRGFAAFLLCEDCGEVPGCPECSISLTVHRGTRSLSCHVCGHREPLPHKCLKCDGIKLREMGAGTESLELELPRLLTGARIERLDRDKVTSATRLEKILTGFREGKSNLLLGTQMLAKGHDFPGVTLVVVILADALFRYPDFRAGERALQVLTQVSGRAGRGEKPGRVLIQTYSPDHPVLSVLKGEVPEEKFMEEEREARKALGYPPFLRLARLRVEHRLASKAKALATELSKKLEPILKGSPELELLGPSEAFLERAKGVTRWDLLLKAKKIEPLLRAIQVGRAWSEESKATIVVDVDPHGLG